MVEEGEIRDDASRAASSSCSPAFDPKIEEYLRPLFQQYYTMSFDNYPVEIERVHGMQLADVPRLPTADPQPDSHDHPDPQGAAARSRSRRRASRPT